MEDEMFCDRNSTAAGSKLRTCSLESSAGKGGRPVNPCQPYLI